MTKLEERLRLVRALNKARRGRNAEEQLRLRALINAIDAAAGIDPTARAVGRVLQHGQPHHHNQWARRPEKPVLPRCLGFLPFKLLAKIGYFPLEEDTCKRCLRRFDEHTHPRGRACLLFRVLPGEELDGPSHLCVNCGHEHCEHDETEEANWKGLS